MEREGRRGRSGKGGGGGKGGKGGGGERHGAMRPWGGKGRAEAAEKADDKV